MEFKRKAYKHLLSWKGSEKRKPLLIRGARQVGKTTLVRMFASEFEQYIELNLEKEADRDIFERSDSTSDLVNGIFLQQQANPEIRPTLLFIDEIQESPKAIQQLRYLYEDFPELYVIAAGSLLEFALQKVPAFPVGRIEYLCLHPLGFDEFLSATGHAQALKALDDIPVPAYSHTVLMDLYRNYTLIGGMPEVVQAYAAGKSLAALPPVYGPLWQSFRDDVEKYADSETSRKVIRHVMETAPFEGDRIKFEGFGRSNYRSREIGEALRALDMARIVQLVYPTTQTAPPAAPDLRKRPRLQFLDTGLLIHALGIQAELLGVDDLIDAQKGRIIQHIVTQELISVHGQPQYRPHFWVREKKDANAEVDLVFQYRNYLIPVEVKAGPQGRLRSLHQFMDACGHPYAVRLLANELGIEEAVTPSGTPYKLLNLPYYLAVKLPEYVAWFVGKEG